MTKTKKKKNPTAGSKLPKGQFSLFETSFETRWEAQEYTPSRVNRRLKKGEEGLKEVKEEYLRLRAVAQKRYKRLVKKYGEDDELVQEYKEGFKTWSELKKGSQAEIVEAFVRTSKFVRSKRSSISERKKTFQKSRQSLSTTFPELVEELDTEEKMKKFGKFMDQVRAFYAGFFFDSDRVVGWYEDKVLNNKKENEDELIDTFKKWASDIDKGDTPIKGKEKPKKWRKRK